MLLTLLLTLYAASLAAQQLSPVSDPAAIDIPVRTRTPDQTLVPDALPDSPGAAREDEQQNVVAVAETSFHENGRGPETCGLYSAMKIIHISPYRFSPVHNTCAELVSPYERFLTTDIILPLTWQQKGYLALHNLSDPANFATIVGISAITIASDPHTAYGPGLKGLGKISGYTLLEDATGQFFGVFAIPALVHQDPRYFRRTDLSLGRRIVYCISRTVIARSDDGKTIPNYATLLNYPITAEIANLYVPGIQPNGESTAVRIVTGIATDPVNNILNEFLPDVAKRIHVRVIFVQTLLNNIAGGAESPGSFQ